MLRLKTHLGGLQIAIHVAMWINIINFIADLIRENKSCHWERPRERMGDQLEHRMGVHGDLGTDLG